MKATNAMVGALLLSMLAGPAWAGDKKAGEGQAVAPAPVKVDRDVRKLPFGKDAKATVRWVRRLVKKTLPSWAASPARVAREVRSVQQSLVALDGFHDSGLEHSIVDEEFKVGNDESVMVWRDGQHAHFFFFWKGQLYKYAKTIPVPKEPDVSASFVDRLESLKSSLGTPTGTYSPDGSADAVAAATWMKRGDDVVVRIVDRRMIHDSDLLVVEHAGLAQKVEAARSGMAPLKKMGVSDELNQFLANPK